MDSKSPFRVLVPMLVGLLTSGCAFITRASLDTAGGDPNFRSGSTGLSISGDGRYVAFESAASNLVPDDGNGQQDVFVRDLQTGTTTRVSVDTAGGDPAGSSLSPSISDDGRYVAFESFAGDLIPDDGNPFSDVFVRDLQNGTTTRASVSAGGGDPDSGSNAPSISADGRYVAFHTGATNLVTGGNGSGTVFVRDLQTGTNTQVSVDSTGDDPNDISLAPEISATGRYVTFFSSASDLVPGDGNGLNDVFVRDLQAGTTVLASVDNAVMGHSRVDSVSPSLSAEGRYVAFQSIDPSDPTGEFVFSAVFVRDLLAGTTTRVSVDTAGGDADEPSGSPSISGDGRYVAFSSAASDLVSGDGNGVGDVFVRDLHTATTIRASVDFFGREANGTSANTSISDDGRYVAFVSDANNLVSGDGTSGPSGSDVFVRAVTIPTIDSVAPPTVARGTTTALTVTGTGFFPGANASASVFGPGGVTVNSVTVMSETELEIVVRVDLDAPPDERNIMVFNPGTGPGAVATGFGFCFGCLAVT